jgi:hypothetical protein
MCFFAGSGQIVHTIQNHRFWWCYLLWWGCSLAWCLCGLGLTCACSKFQSILEWKSRTQCLHSSTSLFESNRRDYLYWHTQVLNKLFICPQSSYKVCKCIHGSSTFGSWSHEWAFPWFCCWLEKPSRFSWQQLVHRWICAMPTGLHHKIPFQVLLSEMLPTRLVQTPSVWMHRIEGRQRLGASLRSPAYWSNYSFYQGGQWREHTFSRVSPARVNVCRHHQKRPRF